MNELVLGKSNDCATSLAQRRGRPTAYVPDSAWLRANASILPRAAREATTMGEWFTGQPVPNLSFDLGIAPSPSEVPADLVYLSRPWSLTTISTKRPSPELSI